MFQFRGDFPFQTREDVTICNKLMINYIYEDRTGGEALEIGDHLIKYHLEC